MTAVPCRPVAGATIFSMLERPQVAGTGFPLGLPKTDFRRQLHRVGSQLPHAAWYSRYRPAAGVRCCTGTAAYVEGREIRPPGRSAPLMSPDVDLTAAVSSFTSLRRAPRRPDQPTMVACMPAFSNWRLDGTAGWPAERSKGGGTGGARSGGHEGSRPPGSLGPRAACTRASQATNVRNGSVPASQVGERSARDRSLTSRYKTASTRIPSVRRELFARALSRCPCCSPAPSATSPLGWIGAPRIPRCRAPTSCSRSWQLA